MGLILSSGSGWVSSPRPRSGWVLSLHRQSGWVLSSHRGLVGSHPFIGSLVGSHLFIAGPVGSHPFIGSPVGSHPFIGGPVGSHPLIGGPVGSHPLIGGPVGSLPLIGVRLGLIPSSEVRLGLIPSSEVRLGLIPSSEGGRRSPAVACWASDHWVASSNPLRGKFRHYFRLIIPGVCLAQFSLSNVHKRGLKHHNFIPSSEVRLGIITSSIMGFGWVSCSAPNQGHACGLFGSHRYIIIEFFKLYFF